ncbi:YlbG family protein [Bacillus sp. 165]|uniref:YlbG family protein n=1 Tax=Bacillus sp. 165 TaxID=1529117 RepID=UPI001AD9ABAD|nr:YlbG family protein [Bacillus sp. 165]MBO9130286.1 YlbG family protein [Bacillus sp. 165]
MFGQRQGIIVYLHSLKYAKPLRKYGNIHYISRRLKYVVLYCDMEQVEQLMEKLDQLQFVKKIEPSYRPFLKTEFENAKPDRAKEYDYKVEL